MRTSPESTSVVTHATSPHASKCGASSTPVSTRSIDVRKANGNLLVWVASVLFINSLPMGDLQSR
jgi:hypothetical protein